MAHRHRYQTTIRSDGSIGLECLDCGAPPALLDLAEAAAVAPPEAE